MNHNEKYGLKDPAAVPTGEVLLKALGESYPAYEEMQEALPSLEIEQDWQWYTPYKAWLAKGQHFWTTKRGTKKEKTLYWLYVFEGSFSLAVWFKEKDRQELLSADLSEEAKERIRAAETMGKLPTFPVVFDIEAVLPLADICALIECKKRLEK